MSEVIEKPNANRKNTLWVVVLSLVAIAIVVLTHHAMVTIPARQQLLLKIQLKNAGFRYHKFNDVYSRPPQDLAEFMEYEPGAAGQSRDLLEFSAKVRDGEITVLWGSELFSNGWESDQHVLAYESSAAESGGVVLMGGGSVDVVTAEEFAALLRLPQGDLDRGMVEE